MAQAAYHVGAARNNCEGHQADHYKRGGHEEEYDEEGEEEEEEDDSVDDDEDESGCSASNTDEEATETGFLVMALRSIEVQGEEAVEEGEIGMCRRKNIRWDNGYYISLRILIEGVDYRFLMKDDLETDSVEDGSIGSGRQTTKTTKSTFRASSGRQTNKSTTTTFRSSSRRSASNTDEEALETSATVIALRSIEVQGEEAVEQGEIGKCRRKNIRWNNSGYYISLRILIEGVDYRFLTKDQELDKTRDPETESADDSSVECGRQTAAIRASDPGDRSDAQVEEVHSVDSGRMAPDGHSSIDTLHAIGNESFLPAEQRISTVENDRVSKCASCDFCAFSKVTSSDSKFAPKTAARSDTQKPSSYLAQTIDFRSRFSSHAESASPRFHATNADSDSEFLFVPAPHSFLSKTSEFENTKISEPVYPIPTDSKKAPKELPIPRSLAANSVEEPTQPSQELAVHASPRRPPPTNSCPSPRRPPPIEPQLDASPSAAARRAKARLAALQVKYVKKKSEGASHWIQSEKADLFFGVVIVIQSINLGIEMEAALNSADGTPDSAPFAICLIVKIICVLVFLLELSLRIRAEGFFGYFTLEKPYHTKRIFASRLLDASMVYWATVDAFLSIIQKRSFLAIASSFRLFGLCRLPCVTRCFYRFPELPVLVFGIAKAFRIGFWSVLILVFGCYCGSLFCADVFVRSNDSGVRHLFGSLSRSMVTHIKFALGEDWLDVALPMFQITGVWRYYIAVFVCVANLLLLSMVAGVICERVFATSVHIPPLSAEVWATEIQTFRDELHACLTSHEIPATISGYGMLFCFGEVQDCLRKFGIRFPRDEQQAAALLKEHLLVVFKRKGIATIGQENSIGVTAETEIPFEYFFEALIRLRGAQTDRVSQEMHNDIARCDKLSLKCIAEVHHDLHDASRGCIARTYDVLSERLAVAASAVLLLDNTLSPESHAKTTNPLTMQMFNDQGAELCAEFEEISQVLKATMMLAGQPLSKLESDRENKALDLVLDERSSLASVERASMKSYRKSSLVRRMCKSHDRTEQVHPSADAYTAKDALCMPRSSSPISTISQLKANMSPSPLSQRNSENQDLNTPASRESSGFSSPSPGTSGWRLPVASSTIRDEAALRNHAGIAASSENPIPQAARVLSLELGVKAASSLETLPAPPSDDVQPRSSQTPRDNYGRLSLPSTLSRFSENGENSALLNIGVDMSAGLPRHADP